MTGYIPYIADISIYDNFRAPTKIKPFYVTQRGGLDIPAVQLVSPTEQIVQRAKAELKRDKKSRKLTPIEDTYIQPTKKRKRSSATSKSKKQKK